MNDQWGLSQILGFQAYAAILAGNPIVASAAGEEGLALADAVGDRFMSRMCRYWGVASARCQLGDLTGAIALFRDIWAEADAEADVIHGFLARVGLAHSLVVVGAIPEARNLAEGSFAEAKGLGPDVERWAYAQLAQAALAAGDLEAAASASEAAWQRISAQPETAAADVTPVAELALAGGDLIAAKQWADGAVSVTTGWFRAHALITVLTLRSRRAMWIRVNMTFTRRLPVRPRSRPT